MKGGYFTRIAILMKKKLKINSIPTEYDLMSEQEKTVCDLEDYLVDHWQYRHYDFDYIREIVSAIRKQRSEDE